MAAPRTGGLPRGGSGAVAGPLNLFAYGTSILTGQVVDVHQREGAPLKGILEAFLAAEIVLVVTVRPLAW